jgi:4'-phosphopantetheinyl transferase
MRVLFAKAGSAASVENWMTGMSPEKRSRISRMRNTKDAWAAITAHRLLCYSLKTSFGLTPAPDDWGTGEHGKPYLKSAGNIHFNISHSGTMVMCALHDSPVGADIERIKPYTGAVARRIMSDEEWEYYLSSKDKGAVFFKIWTIKEAYLKYSGSGLSALDRITVLPLHDGIKSNIEICRFTLIGGIPGYQAAVCADTAAFSVEHVEKGALNSFKPC